MLKLFYLSFFLGIGLLSSGQIMAQNTAAKNCKKDMTECVKKCASAKTASIESLTPKAIQVGLTTESTAALNCQPANCKPADCPPECRVLCCDGAAARTSTSTTATAVSMQSTSAKASCQKHKRATSPTKT